MAKRVISPLLFSFLSNVEAGYIHAKKEVIGSNSGTKSLSQMCKAIDAILSGADPYDALQITQSVGRDKEPYTDAMTVFIHYHKYEMNEYWSTVESLAKDWFTDRGYKPVKSDGLKKILQRNSEYLESALVFRDLFKQLLEDERTVGLDSVQKSIVDFMIETERDQLIGLIE